MPHIENNMFANPNIQKMSGLWRAAGIANGLRISMTKPGAAGVGQQIECKRASGTGTGAETTTGQQLFQMAKEIGAMQQTALEVWWG